MKKIIATIVLLSLISMSETITRSVSEAVPVFGAAKEQSSITYLLCGYDDAAQNTDSIVLATYSYSENRMTFMQIPRDTYCATAQYSKINSIYPSARASGATEMDSLWELKHALSSALGISIDACIGYTMDTFVGFIDSIGGIDITLPQSFTIKNDGGEAILSLDAGEKHLSGQEALAFVRARNGYTAGDLGRIDAQKLFLSAFMSKLKNDIGFGKIVKACIATAKGWTIDAKIGDLLKIAKKNKGRISSIETQYVNAPGMAISNSEGIWYYSIASEPMDQLLSEAGFMRCGGFDPNKIFLNEKDESFANIYNSTKIQPEIFNDETLKELYIATK